MVPVFHGARVCETRVKQQTRVLKRGRSLIIFAKGGRSIHILLNSGILPFWPKVYVFNFKCH